MLQHISISNFAIIANLELELKPQMTVITGETGAGKSIVIDALDIALGDRADPQFIRQDCKSSEISIIFDITHNIAAKHWLVEHALESDNECVFRRIFNREGRSRHFVNGHAVTLQQLRELGLLLVHIHAQHQHQALLKRDQQRQILDNHPQHADLLKKIQLLYQQWQTLKQQKQQLQKMTENKTAQQELFRYQLNELEILNFHADELEPLHQQQKKMYHAEQLTENLQEALLCCHDAEHSALSQLQRGKKALHAIQNIYPTVAQAITLLDQALVYAEEATHEIRTHNNDIESDPEQLQKIEHRLNKIYELARKHHVEAIDLPLLQEKLHQQLEQLENVNAELKKIDHAQAECLQHYQKFSEELSQCRQATAKKLSQAITQSMHHLGMPNGNLVIACEPQQSAEPQAFGIDSIDFLVSANPGQAPQPLAKVASGGELSRISLAIQVITAQTETTPTLIFDEVDVGIGGGTADIVGQLLRKLGETTQVICITHLAQVAAQGHHHFTIKKQAKTNTTQVELCALAGKERIEEIARMIGGIKMTEQTRAHAKEMLEMAEAP
jgi:DNA repair protein RecN (Recombination protein N)